jgi:hypothetical protein
MPSGVNQYDTLTAQQHYLANTVTSDIARNTGWNPMFGDQADVQGNALRQSLLANPSAMLSPSATSQYSNKSVATPLLRQYDQTIMPRLNDAYAAAGALMGSRRGFAQQQQLQNMQTTIGQQLGAAQLQNMHESAQLAQQTAQRQAATVAQQQQMQLGYNQLGAEMTGQSHMALQPYQNSGGMGGGGNPGSSTQKFTGTSTGNMQTGGYNSNGSPMPEGVNWSQPFSVNSGDNPFSGSSSYVDQMTQQLGGQQDQASMYGTQGVSDMLGNYLNIPQYNIGNDGSIGGMQGLMQSMQQDNLGQGPNSGSGNWGNGSIGDMAGFIDQLGGSGGNYGNSDYGVGSTDSYDNVLY